MNIPNIKPVVIDVGASYTDPRIPIHKQTLINRISQFICIVSDYMQAPLLKEFDGLTIPFYAVGVDEDMCHEFRMYFAEVYYEAIFNDGGRSDAWPIAGHRITQRIPLPEMIRQWAIKAYANNWILTQAERDYVFEFCNPIHVQLFRHESFISMHGAGAYINGIWHDHTVDGRLIKYFLGYDERVDRIVEGEEFVLPSEFGIAS